MSQNDEIKIRALPRGGDKSNVKEKPRVELHAEKPQGSTGGKKRWIIYIVTASLAGLVAIPVVRSSQTGGAGRSSQLSGKAVRKVTQYKVTQSSGSTELSSLNARINDSVNRHLQDSEIKTAMMRHTREMENMQFRNARNEPNDADVSNLQENPSFGAHLESDGAAERVFEDLASDAVPVEPLVSDRINSRLANRKWLAEQERAEKIQFITSFVRSAYDRGYEVDIDQNLIVVGVHPVSTKRTLNINQVIDRLAKQGL